MAEDESVREIFHQSLNTVGLSDIKMFRREGSSLSVASLPATILTPKPFKSKIPTPMKGSSGRSTPLGGSRTDLSKLNNPPPVPPKPSLCAAAGQDGSAAASGGVVGNFRKMPLRREISSPPSLENRRGSLDLFKSRAGSGVPTASGPLRGAIGPLGSVSKIPQWKGSTESLSVKGHIRKWESSASLEVSEEF